MSYADPMAYRRISRFPSRARKNENQAAVSFCAWYVAVGALAAVGRRAARAAVPGAPVRRRAQQRALGARRAHQPAPGARAGAWGSWS